MQHSDREVSQEAEDQKGNTEMDIMEMDFEKKLELKQLRTT